MLLLEWVGSSERIGKPDLALGARDHARYLAPRLGLLFLGAALLEVTNCSVDRVQPVQISPESITQTRPSFRAVTDTSDKGRHNCLNRDRIDRPQGPDHSQLIFRFVGLIADAPTGHKSVELIFVPNLAGQKE